MFRELTEGYILYENQDFTEHERNIKKNFMIMK